MLEKKQSEAFLAVVETGSFEKAGEKLCLTPSAISLRVQALEKGLGQLLIIRSKPCTLTPSGYQVLEYLKKSQRLEENFLHNLMGKSPANFFKVIIASNADSLATWLLPTLKEVLIKNKILLNLIMDDQAHTYSLLEKGIVNACISIESKPMKGCRSQYLGEMNYKMIATKDFTEKWFPTGINRKSLCSAPAVIFNEKDDLHFDTLTKQFGLTKGSYPFHLIPSSESFLTAIRLGLGYGMVPELQLNALSDQDKITNLMPNLGSKVQLYWHHWIQQPEYLENITSDILKYSKLVLRPSPSNLP